MLRVYVLINSVIHQLLHKVRMSILNIFEAANRDPIILILKHFSCNFVIYNFALSKYKQKKRKGPRNLKMNSLWTKLGHDPFLDLYLFNLANVVVEIDQCFDLQRSLTVIQNKSSVQWHQLRNPCICFYSIPTNALRDTVPVRSRKLFNSRSVKRQFWI